MKTVWDAAQEFTYLAITAGDSIVGFLLDHPVILDSSVVYTHREQLNDHFKIYLINRQLKT